MSRRSTAAVAAAAVLPVGNGEVGNRVLVVVMPLDYLKQTHSRCRTALCGSILKGVGSGVCAAVAAAARVKIRHLRQGAA